MDEDATLSPAEALALAQRQRATSRRALQINEAVIYAAWGVAWLVAYGVTFLVYGGPTPPIAPLPEWSVGLVWPVAMLGASLVMGAHMARRRRGISGASVAEGRLFGLAWVIAFAGALPVGFALRPGGPEDPVYWMFPWVIVTIVLGAAYVFGAVGWQDRIMFAIGAWILAVNAVGVLIGFAWYPLLMAVAGGGGFLVAAAMTTRRHRRSA